MERVKTEPQGHETDQTSLECRRLASLIMAQFCAEQCYVTSPGKVVHLWWSGNRRILDDAETSP